MLFYNLYLACYEATKTQIWNLAILLFMYLVLIKASSLNAILKVIYKANKITFVSDWVKDKVHREASIL